MIGNLTKITTPVVELDDKTIIEVLETALETHESNQSIIEKCYENYIGDQDINGRTKEIRPEICNKIVENRSYQFVEFKTSYAYSDKIIYASKSSNEEKALSVGAINDMMSISDKLRVDQDVRHWGYICGTGYKLILPNEDFINALIDNGMGTVGEFSGDEAPFVIYSIAPKDAFVIYSSSVSGKPLVGVICTELDDDVFVYTAYTKETIYTIINDGELRVESKEANNMTYIPLIEYPINEARLGVVANIVNIQDAINLIDSNRIDSIEQFVQSLLVVYNGHIPEEKAKSLRDAGIIEIKSTNDLKGDIKLLESTLNQTETQTLVDYMYQTMIDVCAMPNRNSSNSSGDTGTATYIRDGWQATEKAASKDATLFESSELQSLNLILKIVRDTVGTPLMRSDIKIIFPKRDYRNDVACCNIFVQLMSLVEKNLIHPLLPYIKSGWFDDPQAEYIMGQKYIEEHQQEMAQKVSAEDTSSMTPEPTNNPQEMEYTVNENELQ